MKNQLKPILWATTGASLSLSIVFPLVIGLQQYDAINHSKPLSEVIISVYKSLSQKIHLESVLSILIFLAIGGLIGYLLYFLKTYLNKKEKDISISELLEKGESENTEFKSSLRWDYMQNKTNNKIDLAVLKTIAAFMNTRGGTLLIGVSDDASIIGLEEDYQSLKKKDRDGFERHLIELVAKNIGKDYCKNIRVLFFERQGKDICVVAVKHIKAPVFLKFEQHTSFYIRTGNHTRELDIQEAINYIKNNK